MRLDSSHRKRRRPLTIQQSDIAIIGAGVVGCAIAQELSLRYGNKKKIMVIEKFPGIGLETSSLNSGVLHSGIHQDPNFLKSRLAFEGSQKAAEYMKSKGLPILNCGMLIAISMKALRSGLYREWQNLYHLIRRGKEQGIKFQFLTAFGVKKLEPNIQAVGGIFIPNVWVIDPKMFFTALAKDAQEKGVNFFCNEEVIAIERGQSDYRIKTEKYKDFEVIGTNEYRSAIVINSAGLYADEVAALAGFSNYKIYPWRGEYYEAVNLPKNLVSRLIYPAVPYNYPGKGIHFSPRVDGSLFLGPNARPVPKKCYYIEEQTPVGQFLEAAQQFCPMIKKENLKWAYSGIRPKLTDQPEETDFIIRLDAANPPFINLIGIESPGLSASMAIARYVSDVISTYT